MTLKSFNAEIEEARKNGDINVVHEYGDQHGLSTIGLHWMNSRFMTREATGLLKATSPSTGGKALVLGFGLGVEVAEILERRPDFTVDGISLSPISPYRRVNIDPRLMFKETHNFSLWHEVLETLEGRAPYNTELERIVEWRKAIPLEIVFGLEERGIHVFSDRLDQPIFKQHIGDIRDVLASIHQTMWHFIYDNFGPLKHAVSTEFESSALLNLVCSRLTPDGALYCGEILAAPSTAASRGQTVYWRKDHYGKKLMVLGPEHPSAKRLERITASATSPLQGNVRQVTEALWLKIIEALKT